MLKYLCVIFCSSVYVHFGYCEILNQDQDTYLNALQNSHQTNVADHEDTSFHSNNGFHSTGYDFQPQQHFGKPLQSYGPPAASYGPPSQVYGSPKPIFGLPPKFFGDNLLALHHPRDDHWFFDKFKFKLNLFTIGKILLKLLIFKKIIKFIALICLLLFLPKLKHLFYDPKDELTDSMEVRSFPTDKENLKQRINDITGIVLTAFETFSKTYEGCERDKIWCRFQKMVDLIDRK